MIQIFVNNQTEQTTPQSLQSWMEQKGLVDKKGLALAKNDEMVPRSAWEQTQLQAGDHLLLIQATQGG